VELSVGFDMARADSQFDSDRDASLAP
jgi:hypothetical protein